MIFIVSSSSWPVVGQPEGSLRNHWNTLDTESPPLQAAAAKQSWGLSRETEKNIVSFGEMFACVKFCCCFRGCLAVLALLLLLLLLSYESTWVTINMTPTSISIYTLKETYNCCPQTKAKVLLSFFSLPLRSIQSNSRKESKFRPDSEIN